MILEIKRTPPRKKKIEGREKTNWLVKDKLLIESEIHLG